MILNNLIYRSCNIFSMKFKKRCIYVCIMHIMQFIGHTGGRMQMCKFNYSILNCNLLNSNYLILLKFNINTLC